MSLLGSNWVTAEWVEVLCVKHKSTRKLYNILYTNFFVFEKGNFYLFLIYLGFYYFLIWNLIVQFFICSTLKLLLVELFYCQ